MLTLEGRSQSQAFTDTDDTPLGRALVLSAEAHPGASGVFALPDGLEAFAARVLLARAATRSIDAQYYIWHDDLTGGLLFDELRKAADRGVRVRLLLDDNTTTGVDPVIATLNAHPNIEIRLFNPFTIRQPRLLGYLTDFARLNRRMHNKSFTVDNQATIVGGRNVGDEYFGAGSGALFVDLDVLAVGAVVPDVSHDFDRYWACESSYPADRIVSQLDEGERHAVEQRLSSITLQPKAAQYIEAVRALPLVDDLLNGRVTFDWVPVQLVSDDPCKGLGRATSSDLLFSKLTKAIGEPQRRWDLVSGYFVPTKTGTAALSALAARGVATTVLTNALEATDVPIVHAGYAKWRKPLLRAGVRLFELRRHGGTPPPKPKMVGAGSTGVGLSSSGSALHAKTFVLDSERLFVGSFNFDPRSTHLNTELGFVIDAPELAARMQQALAERTPDGAYEVRLSPDGNLVWIERDGEREIRHHTEPGTTWRQRVVVWALSLLPIDWLL